MPDFLETFDTAENVGGVEWDDLSPFVHGYIQALFFTNEATGVSMVEWGDEETQEALVEGELDGCLPTDAGFSDLHPDFLQSIVSDCSDFEAKARHLLSQAYAAGYDRDQAGRDFWFTRNGHGVGFWDRKELEGDAWQRHGSPRVGEPGWEEYAAEKENSLGNQLSDVARSFGGIDVYFAYPDEESPTGYGYVREG